MSDDNLKFAIDMSLQDIESQMTTVLIKGFRERVNSGRFWLGIIVSDTGWTEEEVLDVLYGRKPRTLEQIAAVAMSMGLMFDITERR